MSPKRWSLTHFFHWSTTISFSGFMVQVGKKSKNLSIIDRTWNVNKRILKLHVTMHTNLHLNVITFWFERIVVRLKTKAFNFSTWICILSMAPWAHNKPQTSLNTCMTSIKFYILTILANFSKPNSLRTNSCMTKCTMEFQTTN